MNRVHCTNCGEEGHVRWDCRKPAKSSTAALTEVQVRKHRGDAVFPSDPQAGTQALPVDTNSSQIRTEKTLGSDGRNAGVAQSVVALSKAKPIQKPNRTADRHKPGYLARYMREVYRPRIKAMKGTAPK